MHFAGSVQHKQTQTIVSSYAGRVHIIYTQTKETIMYLSWQVHLLFQSCQLIMDHLTHFGGLAHQHKPAWHINKATLVIFGLLHSQTLWEKLKMFGFLYRIIFPQLLPTRYGEPVTTRMPVGNSRHWNRCCLLYLLQLSLCPQEALKREVMRIVGDLKSFGHNMDTSMLLS